MTISIVSSCYNESENIPRLLNALEKIQTMIHVERIILIDNGSTDNTQQILNSITSLNQLQIITSRIGSTYSEGVLSGLQQCKGSFVLLFHSDLQFCPVDFIGEVVKGGENLNENYAYIGIRKNRPPINHLISWCLQIFACIRLGLKFYDYNAQPKLFFNDLDHKKMQTLRGFSIDIAICAAMKDRYLTCYNSYEKARNQGSSSWKSGLSSWFRLAKSYVVEIEKIKRIKY